MKCENCFYSKMAITVKDKWEERNIEFKCTLDHCKKKEDEKMTNWDKFKDYIETTAFAINEKGDIVRCSEIKCRSCDFRRSADSRLLHCSERRAEWLKAEYESREKKIARLKRDIYERLFPTWDIACQETGSCVSCPMHHLKAEAGLEGRQTCYVTVRTIIFAGVDALLDREQSLGKITSDK